MIEECKTLFNCSPISETMTTREYKFLHQYIYLGNELCKLFSDRAIVDLSTQPYSCVTMLSLVKIS